jgi:hypothetical protein
VLGSAPLGLWATLAPLNFYENFPGAGHHWVMLDGPYNHHLISDFGALNMALAAVTIGALIYMTTPFLRVTAIAWLLYTVPHLVYHAGHTDPFSTNDKIGVVGGVGFLAVLAAYLLFASARVTPATANGRANSS